MTTQDADDRSQSLEEAARKVQDEPSLQASAGGEDSDPAVDDDATTPDRAVSNEE